MRKTSIILLVFLAVCVGLAWVIFQRTPGRPNVSISLLGYTNEPSGTRLGVFAVTNLGPATVYLYAPLTVGAVYTRSNWPTWHVMLSSDAGSRFTIPAPSNEEMWIVSLRANPDIGAVRHIIHIVARTAERMPYSIDWTNSEK
jgi:hypothetical protein